MYDEGDNGPEHVTYRKILIHDDPIMKLSYSFHKSGVCKTVDVEDMRATVKKWTAREESLKAK